jgi:glycosyltransferase involved in cell wall biosynthesis
MRIGLFSPTINTVGGGEWVALNMINALASKKYRIAVYSAAEINSANLRRFFGCDLLLEEVVSWPSIFDPYALESIYANCFRAFMFSIKVDLLIDTFSDELLPWTDAVYFNRTPRTLRLPKDLRGTFFLPYKMLLKKSYRNVRASDKVLLTGSNWSARVIEESTRLPVHVLSPPISGIFKIDDVKNSMKSDIVSTVARMSPEKNLEMVPKVAKLVPGETSFVIMSKCQNSAELKALNLLRAMIRRLGLEKKVTIMVNLSRKEQANMLKRSKVYFHPTPYESFGLSIVEAMSAGCIPIVPDNGGPRDYVPEEFRYTSLEEATSLIKTSILNWSPSKAEKFKEAANEFNQSRFREEFLSIMKL